MTDALDRIGAAPPVVAARRALGPDSGAFVVGGAIRDALLDRPLRDVDLVVPGDVEAAARAVGEEVRGPVFALSEEFGAWRAIDRAQGLTCDISPLREGGIVHDLAARDFTVNAMATPLAGGELIDPYGGQADAAAGVLRVLGASAYGDDALRPLRLARLAAELGLAPDDETERLTRAAASRVATASPERQWAELRRLIIAPGVLHGLDLAGRLGLVSAVLPELEALAGVEQSHFHHLDVRDHTLEVLRRQLELEADPAAVFGDLAEPLQAELNEPLADELTRGQALRLGALLHDIGKPVTRGVRPDGRVTFIGHDSIGAGMVEEVCRRLRTSQRLREHLAALTRHHLVLGFLVRERPLPRGTVYRYLVLTQPVEVEVTLLTCADRLATRGRNAEAAIEAHLELARELMGDALRWRAEGPARSAVDGNVLADEAGIERGPALGAVLARLAEARFTGEATTREAALQLARRLRDDAGA